MTVEINIASCVCQNCRQPLATVKGFADTPVKAWGGAWGYICEDYCSELINNAIASRFDTVIENGFAIGRKRLTRRA